MKKKIKTFIGISRNSRSLVAEIDREVNEFISGFNPEFVGSIDPEIQSGAHSDYIYRVTVTVIVPVANIHA